MDGEASTGVDETDGGPQPQEREQLGGSTLESPSGDVVPASRGRGAVRSDVVPPLLVAAAAAVVLGLVWWQLGPALGRATDPAEVAVAGDAAYALPALLAGLLTAGWLVARPGRRPLLRILVALAGGVLGSLGAWGLGRGLGAAPVRAWAVLLVWPIALSVGVMIANLVATITAPE